MKKQEFLGAVIVTSLVGICCGLAARGKAEPEPKELAPRRRVVVTANGVTEGARPEVQVRPEIVGTVVAIHARENQDVPAGSLLAVLENEDHQAQVELAAAELAMPNADLDRLRNGERLLRRQSSAAFAKSKENAYKLALDHWERARNAMGGASRQDLQKAEYQMRQARDEWEMARKEQDLVEAPPRVEDVAKTEATVSRAKAQLRKARAELAKSRLRAPFACRILKVNAEVGELVGPASAQPFVVLADLSRHRVRAFVEELDAFAVGLGQRAVVTVDGLPGREFVGRIAEVLPSMGRRRVHSEAAGEYKDVHFREVLIDLERGEDLPLNLRVKTWIEMTNDAADANPQAAKREEIP